jgi:hypothetical protein
LAQIFRKFVPPGFASRAGERLRPVVAAHALDGALAAQAKRIFATDEGG